MAIEIEDLTLEELKDIHDISVRTCNICINGRLTTLHKILDIYNEYGSFKKFRNAGEKSEYELKKLCQYYINGEYGQQKIKPLNKISEINLDEHFKNLFNALPTRAKKVITARLENVNYRDYEYVFINTKLDTTSLKNSGRRTHEQIQDFNRQLFAHKIEQRENPIVVDDNFLNLMTLLSLKNIPPELLLKYQDDFLNKKLPFFVIFKDEYLPTTFGEKKLFIIEHLLYKDFENLSRNEISAKVKLTNERIRQIEHRLIPQLLSFFDIDSNLAAIVRVYCNYLNPNSDFLNLRKALESSANTDFDILNQRFYLKALVELYKETFTSVFVDSASEYFLIKNELYNSFNFQRFIDMLESNINGRGEIDKLNFEGVLYQFRTTEALNNLDRIKPICIFFIENVYNLYINLENEIVFRKSVNNTFTNEILKQIQEFGSPIHIDLLLDKLKEKFPDKSLTSSTVRSLVLRIPGIISISRTSTYGLKEWELTKEGIKGGSIRDIVEEILEKYPRPLHITEIYQDVRRFRNTNQKNIIANLKLDVTNRFVFFNNEFVGLPKSDYSPKMLEKIEIINNPRELLSGVFGDKRPSEKRIYRVLKDNFDFSDTEVELWRSINKYRLRGIISNDIQEFTN